MKRLAACVSGTANKEFRRKEFSVHFGRKLFGSIKKYNRLCILRPDLEIIGTIFWKQKLSGYKTKLLKLISKLMLVLLEKVVTSNVKRFSRIEDFQRVSPFFNRRCFFIQLQGIRRTEFMNLPCLCQQQLTCSNIDVVSNFLNYMNFLSQNDLILIYLIE